MSVPPEMEASSRSALISLRTETGNINSLELVGGCGELNSVVLDPK
jgi:hypothetical protein